MLPEFAYTPSAVFFSKLNNRFLNLFHDPRSSGATLPTAVILASDQFSMPSEQRIRRKLCVQLSENLAPELLGLHRQTPTLVIGQPQALLAQLIAENAVLFLQVVDDIALLLIHPASG